MLANQVGASNTSGTDGTSGTSGDGTSGQTSSGTSGDGTSGQTSSGNPGTSSGGTTSGAPGGCAVEKTDSTEKAPLVITSCAKGTLQIPSDQEDWLQFDRPANATLHAKWTGPISVTFWDDKGRAYTLQQLPPRAGTYLIQIQYDFAKYPLSGDQIAKGPSFDWSFEISF